MTMLLQQIALPAPSRIPNLKARCRGFRSPKCSALQGGRVRRLVLSARERSKMNVAPDQQFYSIPRLVTHVDNAFIQELTQLYRERIPPDSEVLDLMSSWVSHLPKDVPYKRVVGHGLNAEELAANKQLDKYFVQDINKDQNLDDLDDESFDAVICAVSVQYMEEPESVFSEIYRVLRPGGVCIMSFSNRMFYDKAIAAWREGTAYSRIQLVVQYFQSVVGFTEPEVIKKVRGVELKDDLMSRILNVFISQGRDPFYAVVAYRNFRRV